MAGGEYLRLRDKNPGPSDLITQRVNALRVSIPIRAPNRRDFTFPTWSHFPRRGIIETCDDIGPCPIIGSPRPPAKVVFFSPPENPTEKFRPRNPGFISR